MMGTMIQEAEFTAPASAQSAVLADDQLTASQSLQSFLVRARTISGNAGWWSDSARTLDDGVADKVCPRSDFYEEASGTRAADLRRRLVGVPVRWTCWSLFSTATSYSRLQTSFAGWGPHCESAAVVPFWGLRG